MPATTEPAATAATTEQSTSRDEARRQRREEARSQRDALRRRAIRRRLVRGVLAWGAAGLLVAVGIAYFVVQSQAKSRLAAEASRVASAAGCTQIEEKPDRGASHSPPYTYDQQPATSGSHSTPLPSGQSVYETPVPEENAVHNMEHGYAFIYYRQEGDAALPASVAQALQVLAERESKVIMAPYPELEEGRSLALAAWNRLQQCPSTVTPDQATTLAGSFIAQFRGGGDAPEPNVP
ncbi:MAG: DUF3105 domain-containing protein [Actinomycetota bacterium]